jgi:hypothetical protein
MTNDPNENRGPEEQNDQTTPQQGDAPEQAQGQPPQQPEQDQTPPAGTTPETPPEPQAPAAAPQAGQPAGGEMGKKIEEMANMQIGGFSLCKIVALGGAALLFLSFFLPWWGISMERNENPGDLSREELTDASNEFNEAMKGNRDFYTSVLDDDDDDGSQSAFGWDLGRGIVTFIFSFIIAGAVAAVMFVPAVRPFSMFLLLLAGVLAFVVFILTLTVWFGTPGDNVDNVLGEIDQGVSFGTFVALLGSLAVLAGAGYEGVTGLLGFLKAKPAA